jgi:hypothetical protein
MSSLVNRFIRRIASALVSLKHASLQLPQPCRYSVLLGSALDFTRSNAQLVAENALLRQVNKPRFTPAVIDRPKLDQAQSPDVYRA